MAELREFENQACLGCGHTAFVTLVALRARPGGGAVPSPLGYQCANCHQQVDLGAMQRAALLRQRQREIASLQAEMEGLAPAEPPQSVPTEP